MAKRISKRQREEPLSNDVIILLILLHGQAKLVTSYRTVIMHLTKVI